MNKLPIYRRCCLREEIMDLNVLALIATMVFVLIAVFLIPLLIQIKTTVSRVDEMIGLAQRDLLPLLKELRETSENIRKISLEAETDMVRVRPLFESMEEAGGLLHKVVDFLQGDLSRAVGKSVGTWMGMRAASKMFLKQLKNKGR
jgi:predicted PurR-regulated permease PerM